MATDTLPIFRASNDPGEPTFFVRYPHEGTTYCVGFDSIFELTQTLVNGCLDGRLVEQIIDFAEESMEWNERPPVAEAVTYFVSSCDCDACRLGINAEKIAELESDVRTLYRRVGFVLLAIGVAVWLF